MAILNRNYFINKNRRGTDRHEHIHSKRVVYYDKSCPKCGLVVKDHQSNKPYNEFAQLVKSKNKIKCRYCNGRLFFGD